MSHWKWWIFAVRYVNVYRIVNPRIAVKYMPLIFSGSTAPPTLEKKTKSSRQAQVTQEVYARSSSASLLDQQNVGSDSK